MKSEITPIKLTDKSEAWNLIVSSDENESLTFHCISEDSALKLEQALRTYTVDFD